MTHSIPLVIYVDGERKVIGSADVVDDGNDFVVTATVNADAAKTLFPSSTESFSIGQRHASEFGVPKATPESIGAWARMVESQSCLGKESS